MSYNWAMSESYEFTNSNLAGPFSEFGTSEKMNVKCLIIEDTLNLRYLSGHLQMFLYYR